MKTYFLENKSDLNTHSASPPAAKYRVGSQSAICIVCNATRLFFAIAGLNSRAAPRTPP